MQTTPKTGNSFGLSNTDQASLNRFELLSKATKEGIWETDLVSGNVFYNDGIMELFGYTYAEMADNASWWSNNLHPRDKKRVQTALDEFLAGQENVWWGKYQFRSKDGTYKLVLDRMVIVRDEHTKPIKIIGTIQDFEAVNELQQDLYEIRKSEKKQMYQVVLEAEEKEKSFISDTLNEGTNQVLSAINMHIRQAALYVSPEGKKWLEEADHMLHHSIKKIHDLAHRISPASLQLLGINDALDHMLQDLERRKNISFILQVDEVAADKLHKAESLIFYRIAQYQIANIEQHSEATQIVLSLQNVKGKTELKIYDNGAGVDLKQLEYGHGFSNIEQRTENFDGSFSLESTPGIRGFTLSVII